MSFNGLAASFLPFTINGLTDATFSNSILGNAIATSLQLTSATPLKLARFNADRELVSGSVDESQVALLVGNNTFNGSQTILPGSATNINNVIKTAITYEAYNEGSFTTSGISGYTPPLGTLSGPTMGEYSISQTANDRTIMKINGFVPTTKTWVYSFVIRIVDAAEGYLSVEQSGVQRSSTLRLITSELTTVSDTFTYDPASGPIVFKIYTGSLDPWNASWSSFTLGSYTASIMAPLSAPLVATEISTMTIGTEILSFPLISSVNSEAWSVYAVSTMGNPSTLGGLLFQEATLGVGAYITGGVVGAKSFQFNTISGNAGKVVVTNGDQVMSTSISAGQLQYLTGLTSQAGGIGQANTWTGANDFTGLTSVGALRITSSVINADYTLSVNSSDQLEFTNLANGSIFKTNGSDLFVTGTVNCATLGATNVEAGTNIYLAKGSTAEWRTTLGMSDQYEILDNAGVMRSRLSKTTGLTVSTLNITQVPSLTPSLALGINGGGQVVSFAVPAAVNILPLANTFTNTNLFNSTLSTSAFSDVSLGGITTISAVPFSTGQLQTAGISSQANSPGTITFGVPATLTPSPTTAPFASCYSISQLFPTTNARYECLFTGFTSPIFGVSLTIYRANVANTARIAISATVPVVVGTFILGFLPNSNPSFVGQVFLEFSGTANKTMGWTSFTYRQGIETIAGDLTVSGATTTGSVTINSGTGGALTKLGSTTGYYATLAGGNATTSPFLEFYAGGSRRFYMGDATTTEMKFQCENNAQLTLATQGTTRMTIGTTGDITTSAPKFIATGTIGNINGGSNYAVNAGYMATGSLTIGDQTKNYGGGSSWNSNTAGLLFECVANTEIAIHDAGDRVASFMYYSGNNITLGRDMGWGQSNTVIGGPLYCNNLPQNPSSFPYSHTLTYNFSSNQILRSQCMMRQAYFNQFVSWGGGVNITYAFYKYNNGSCPVRLSGKYAMYSTYVGLQTFGIRIYSQNSGVYRYYSLITYQNISIAQTTYPIDLIFTTAQLPELGWFDIYIYNAGGCSTDGNDQLLINVELLPVDSF